MIKTTLKRIARKNGVNFCSTDHLGVDVEVDLQRLAAYDPIKCVFDVGANFGQTALRFVDAFPSATIFSFEPVPQSFKKLSDAVQAQHRVRPINTAMGDKTGSIAINLAAIPGSNSILLSKSGAGSIDVAVDTVDSFAAANAIENIDLLKIDVEGYELQVLKGAERMLSEGKVRYIYAECVLSPDTVEPHTSFFDLHSVFERYGFCFVTYYGESFRLKDGCALGNVLYALRSKLPAKASGRILNIV